MTLNEFLKKPTTKKELEVEIGLGLGLFHGLSKEFRTMAIMASMELVPKSCK